MILGKMLTVAAVASPSTGAGGPKKLDQPKVSPVSVVSGNSTVSMASDFETSRRGVHGLRLFFHSHRGIVKTAIRDGVILQTEPISDDKVTSESLSAVKLPNGKTVVAWEGDCQ